MRKLSPMLKQVLDAALIQLKEESFPDILISSDEAKTDKDLQKSKT